MKAYVIDDEKNAREVLIDKINQFCPNVKVIGDTSSPLQGISDISRLQPDILFLDISMPEMNGFQLVQKIQPFSGEIIFVTAYDNFAIEAFKSCAIGYILKPIDTDQLINTVAICEKLIQQPQIQDTENRFRELSNMGKGEPAKIAVPTLSGYTFIGLKNITRLEANQKYTTIYSNDGPVVSSRNLGYFVDILNDKGFVVTHKSHMINIEYIDTFDKDGVITMKDSTNIPLSRRRRKEFMERFIH